MDELLNFKLNKINLNNYKKYKNETITFDENFTLLIGENASGKTTILDGIATGIGVFLLGIENIESRHTHTIKKNDATMVLKQVDETIEREVFYPVEIISVFKINDKSYSVKRKKNNITGQSNFLKRENKDILEIIKEINNKLTGDERLILPVFSYHGTGRLWEQTMKNSSSMELLQRTYAYKDCLEAKSNYRNFIKWFEKLERHLFNSRKNNPMLTNVKEVIMKTLKLLTDDEVANITYRESDIEIYYTKSDRIDRVGQMSDGYRNIIGIVSDIAYRICILNPHILDCITQTPGIVLIDEIDLHLHPTWQKKIVDILKSIFPKVQFIATSHSPFIIQSMDKNEVIKLSSDDYIDHLRGDS